MKNILLLSTLVLMFSCENEVSTPQKYVYELENLKDIKVFQTQYDDYDSLYVLSRRDTVSEGKASKGGDRFGFWKTVLPKDSVVMYEEYFIIANEEYRNRQIFAKMDNTILLRRPNSEFDGKYVQLSDLSDIIEFEVQSKQAISNNRTVYEILISLPLRYWESSEVVGEIYRNVDQDSLHKYSILDTTSSKDLYSLSKYNFDFSSPYALSRTLYLRDTIANSNKFLKGKITDMQIDSVSGKIMAKRNLFFVYELPKL